MLTLIEGALRELGCIGPGARLRYAIDITAGDAFSIAAYLDRNRFLQVKASEFVPLLGLFEVQTRAWSRYPDMVPRPLGHREQSPWSVMVSEGIPHRPVCRADFLGRWPGAAGRMAEPVLAYFQSAAPAAAVGNTQRRLLDEVVHHFDATPLARLASECVDDAKAHGVESLPERPQHGDFVVNNLGRCGQRLVVFDWEDYEKTGLPGLDVFTLGWSLLGHDSNALDTLSRADDPRLAAFLRRACEGQGLDPGQFRRLARFYLLVFLYLKRNYGARVQERLTALLTRTPGP